MRELNNEQRESLKRKCQQEGIKYEEALEALKRKCEQEGISYEEALKEENTSIEPVICQLEGVSQEELKSYSNFWKAYLSVKALTYQMLGLV